MRFFFTCLDCMASLVPTKIPVTCHQAWKKSLDLLKATMASAALLAAAASEEARLSGWLGFTLMESVPSRFRERCCNLKVALDYLPGLTCLLSYHTYPTSLEKKALKSFLVVWPRLTAGPCAVAPRPRLRNATRSQEYFAVEALRSLGLEVTPKHRQLIPRQNDGAPHLHHSCEGRSWHDFGPSHKPSRP